MYYLDKVGSSAPRQTGIPTSFQGTETDDIARRLPSPRFHNSRRTGLGSRRVDTGPDIEPPFDLREEFDLSLMFIAHDLAVVRHVSDRVGIISRTPVEYGP